MMVKTCLVALVLAQASAFMAPARPMLAATPMVSTPRAAVAPTMMLGGSGRGFMRAFRSVKKGVTPRFGNGKGGVGSGGNMGGGTGNGDANMMASGDGEGGGNPLMAFSKGYMDLLETQPLFAKALTSLVGFAAGDFLAQKFITKGDWDWARFLRLASFGFLIHGTTSHWFYGVLDGKIPGTSPAVVFTKVFIDQVIWNPIFGVMFFSYVAACEGKGLAAVKQKVEKELIVSVTGSWKVWPLAHAINFRFVPSSLRVLYINTIQIGYNCFLSLISSR